MAIYSALEECTLRVLDDESFSGGIYEVTQTARDAAMNTLAAAGCVIERGDDEHWLHHVRGDK